MGWSVPIQFATKLEMPELSAASSPLKTHSCQERGNYSVLLYPAYVRGKKYKQLNFNLFGMAHLVFGKQNPATT